jgi:hypothetical protein
MPGTTIIAAPVKTSGAVLESGVPQRLLLHPYAPYSGADVSPDGRRFLLAVPRVQKTARNAINVVFDWNALFTK